ncbi:MAG TPA: hypothetical protein VNE62_01115 [Actinomycetota bacterium]|nr:hypothetical protein [Actinomycetota bacterium]
MSEGTAVTEAEGGGEGEREDAGREPGEHEAARAARASQTKSG